MVARRRSSPRRQRRHISHTHTHTDSKLGSPFASLERVDVVNLRAVSVKLLRATMARRARFPFRFPFPFPSRRFRRSRRTATATANGQGRGARRTVAPTESENNAIEVGDSAASSFRRAQKSCLQASARPADGRKRERERETSRPLRADKVRI